MILKFEKAKGAQQEVVIIASILSPHNPHLINTDGVFHEYIHTNELHIHQKITVF